MVVDRLTARARELRRNATPAEKILWQHLRAEQMCGLRFRRQQPIGPFVVDFFCASARLVIEVDGESHAGEARAQRDAHRQEFLEQQGLTVLRVLNEEIYENLSSVLETMRVLNEEIYENLSSVLETIAHGCCHGQRPLP